MLDLTHHGRSWANMGIIVVWTFTLPFAMPFIVAELIFNLRSAGAHVGRQMAGYALASIPCSSYSSCLAIGLQICFWNRGWKIVHVTRQTCTCTIRLPSLLSEHL